MITISESGIPLWAVLALAGLWAGVTIYGSRHGYGPAECASACRGTWVWQEGTCYCEEAGGAP